MRTASNVGPAAITRARYLLILTVSVLSWLSTILPWGALEPSAWAATFTVTNTNDSGLGSLREAIVAANAVPGTDTIDFNIAPGGVQTITLLSELPTITNPVVIDGTTQPGFAGAPIIELDGSSTVNAQGLFITAGNSTVRGLVVNRFYRNNGIWLEGSGNNVVEGNYLGTDVSGTALIGSNNMQAGVIVANSSNNRIGGTTAAARNVSAGSSVGVWIVTFGGVSTGNLVQGNYIGTNAQGTAALGNAFGILINGDSSSNTVIDNLISGNSSGISLEACASGNFMLGNRIGTDASGTTPLGNQRDGIVIAVTPSGCGPSQQTVGGPSSGMRNIIAFNSGSGILVFEGSGNAIRGNSIFSNGGLGIELAPGGVTSNDPSDTDTGPNDLQNFPELTSADSSGGNTTIQGTLNSTPNTNFILEFFANAACDPSGNGEGETFLGSTTVTTDGSGNVSFTNIFATSIPTNQFITATATDPSSNTSEFSACVQVTTPVVDADLAITKADSPDPVKVREPLTYTLTVRNNGPLPATGVTVTDTLPSGVTFGAATPSQGNCSGTTPVMCNLGNLAVNAQATVTITVTPTASGTLTNTASVDANEPDPTSANNMAMATTTVSTSGKPLKLTVAVQGQGTVTSSPAGINCRPTCSATYNSGTQVTLTATPAAGQRFTGWSGGGCQGTGTCVVTLTTADIKVTATFKK